MTRDDIRREAEDYLQSDETVVQHDDERTLVQRAAEITKRARDRDSVHGGEPGEVAGTDTPSEEDDDEEGVPGLAISDDQFSRMMELP